VWEQVGGQKTGFPFEMHSLMALTTLPCASALASDTDVHKRYSNNKVKMPEDVFCIANTIEKVFRIWYFVITGSAVALALLYEP
jgi:hypothetical protein